MEREAIAAHFKVPEGFTLRAIVVDEREKVTVFGSRQVWMILDRLSIPPATAYWHAFNEIGTLPPDCISNLVRGGEEPRYELKSNEAIVVTHGVTAEAFLAEAA